MKSQTMIERAMDIRYKYARCEQRRYGHTWTREQIVQGFVGDVGDLVKLSMAQDSISHIPDADRKLEHEPTDCLWSLLVLSGIFGANLEGASLQTMDELETCIVAPRYD